MKNKWLLGNPLSSTSLCGGEGEGERRIEV